jgi:protein-tyrosine phosphatase
MIDIHHHLLWGLDDGARDLETSVAMAKASAADGVTHVVCTPHANSKYTFDPVENKKKASELQARLEAENVNLKIGLGCDFHLSYDNIVEIKRDPTKFTANGLNYVMVEIADFGVPRGLDETFYELQVAGLIPVLTHPERNPTLQGDMTRLMDWMRGGVLVQVTGDSVTGRMGKTAEKMAHHLLSKRWVHFLATDAHNLVSRPPRLSEARDIVAKKYGAEYAHSLVESNPRAVFQGKSFMPLMEPVDLHDEFKPDPWWKKILSTSKY